MRLAASTVQSRQFFESTLPEKLFEEKNKEAIKKSENLRDINTMHGPIQSRETVPINICTTVAVAAFTFTEACQTMFDDLCDESEYRKIS
jgi:hypothetical protein